VSLDAPWLLDPARPGDITRLLRAHGWIAAGDAVRSAGPAGDGNMNCTLRVVTGAGRLILKQGRPWVERYPEIPAPADRTLVEAAFYACVSAHEGVAGRMPRLVGIDHDQRVLVLDDCVGMTDLTGVYEAAPWPAAVESLGECYLHGPPRALLHGDFFPGSWLSDGASARVIDPEFCFAGEPAFDYGVMAAHLILGGHWAAARRTGAAADAAGHDARLAGAFAGVEVMRRLIGVAQLPRLGRSLADKAALLQASRRLVLGLEPLAGA
jgi:5-methylthioribose kinase